jgi:hypothetical protein
MHGLVGLPGLGPLTKFYDGVVSSRKLLDLIETAGGLGNRICCYISGKCRDFRQTSFRRTEEESQC